jgi:hypothetical protein
LANRPLGPWTALLLMLAAARVCAGDLNKVWELRLSELTGGKITDTNAHVFSVSFSPDGHRLAAVVWGGQQDRGKQTLVVVDISRPRDGVQMTEFEGPAWNETSWSYTGKEIAVPEVFHELGRPPCILQHTIRTVFYDTNRVADGQPGFPNSDLLFFDSNCNPLGSWAINGMWELSDGSAERHLLALANHVPKGTQILVVDPIRERIVSRRSLQEVTGAWPLFADSGNAVCALDGTGRHGVAHCWDVDSGREIGQTSSGNPHRPMATALRAKRAVLSDYGWRIYFEGWETEVGSLHRRVVWDFGTGKEIASWKPKYQDDVARPASKEPLEFAISPDGTMVAEGGDGLLTLSRVEP